jgi:flavin-dependent amine oxidoreductase
MADARSNGDRSVTIVGAGIAGLTAALRLLDVGYDVTVLERDTNVGGKFGAIGAGGVFHEHAYHFLADWCLNFWNLAGRLQLSKTQDFVRRDAIKFLRPKKPGRAPGSYEFLELKHASPTANFWDNVHSGVIPPDDMIAYAYSLLDLLTAPDDDPDELEFLNRISVNGFMRSLTYMTDRAALLHQEALLKAFAVPSYDTSVRSYRTFLRYFGRDSGGWILRGDSYSTFWARFRTTLESFAGLGGKPRFDLQLKTALKAVEVEPDPCCPGRGRVIGIEVEGRGRRERLSPKHLILTIPYGEVVKLVESSKGLREYVPDLLDLRKLRSHQMASLDLYFKNPLPGIPPEHVTLIDDAKFDEPYSPANDGDIASQYGLSFVDNYQAWEGRVPPRETWLNVVSADFEKLAHLPDEEARRLIIEELRRYLDFETSDIDWSRSYFRSNVEAPLFANTVGSWQFRPETRTDRPEYTERWVHSRVRNLYLAGDYCRSKIDLVCLEGAVTTGISAARAIAGEAVAAPLVPADVSRQECEQAKAALAPWLALTAKGRTFD